VVMGGETAMTQGWRGRADAPEALSQVAGLFRCHECCARMKNEPPSTFRNERFT